MREFWLASNVRQASDLPCFPDIYVDLIRAMPLNSYDDYLARYELVQKK